MVFTSETDLFRPTQSMKHLVKKIKLEAAVKRKHHDQGHNGVKNVYFGKLSVCKQISLFWRQFFCSCCDPDEPLSIQNGPARWYTIGSERLDKEFDVVKIVKRLRELRLLTREQRRAQDLKSELAISGKNIIEIDSDGIADNEEEKEKLTLKPGDGLAKLSSIFHQKMKINPTPGNSSVKREPVKIGQIDLQTEKANF